MPPQGPPLMSPQSINEKQLPSLLSLKVDPPEQLMEGGVPTEVVLPQVLQQVLVLKSQRALELGVEDAGNENATTAPAQAAEADKETPMPLWERDDNADVDANSKQSKDSAKVTKNKNKTRKKNKKKVNENKDSNEEKVPKNYAGHQNLKGPVLNCWAPGPISLQRSKSWDPHLAVSS